MASKNARGLTYHIFRGYRYNVYFVAIDTDTAVKVPRFCAVVCRMTMPAPKGKPELFEASAAPWRMRP